MTVPGEECSRRSLSLCLWLFQIEIELRWKKDQTPVPELLLILCDILPSCNNRVLSPPSPRPCVPSWFYGIWGMGGLRKVSIQKGNQRQGSLFSLTERTERTRFGSSTSAFPCQGQSTVREGIKIHAQFCCIRPGFSFLMCQVRRLQVHSTSQSCHKAETFLKS